MSSAEDPYFQADFDRCMHGVAHHSGIASWEYAWKELDAAHRLATRPGKPLSYLREVLIARGGLERRLANYDGAIDALKQARKTTEDSDLPASCAAIYGEMGVVYLHQDHFEEARQSFQEQVTLSVGLIDQWHGRPPGEPTLDTQTILDAEAQVCRGLGNLGYAMYHLAIDLDSPEYKPAVRSRSMLQIAITKLLERVEHSKGLIVKLEREAPSSQYIAKAQMWRSIGLDRLCLAYVADGNTEAAVECGKQSNQMTQLQGTSAGSQDPTVRALSRFYSGYALFHDGQVEEARALWNYVDDRGCSSAIALCKEPHRENLRYLRLLAVEGCVSLQSYDGQGYSALDYAVLSNNQAFQNVIIAALERELKTNGEDPLDVQRKLDIYLLEARRRRQYRDTFQRTLRPFLVSVRDDIDIPLPYMQPGPKRKEQCVRNIRKKYVDDLQSDSSKAEVFGNFRYMSYIDFRDHLDRLPRPNSKADMERIYQDGLIKEYADLAPDFHEQYIVFMSYRWLGSGDMKGPDDEHNTQYNRMIHAMNGFIAKQRLDPRKIGVWMDAISIDQIDDINKARGVNALPLLLTQCNAILTLVDEHIFTRAWCAIENLIMHTLAESYELHECWEHRWEDHGDGLSRQRGTRKVDDDLVGLQCSYESDLPTLKFLVRQTRILA